MKRRGMVMGQGSDWWLPASRLDNHQTIFVGLNVDPFEDAHREDIRNTIIISAILLLLGVGGFFDNLCSKLSNDQTILSGYQRLCR